MALILAVDVGHANAGAVVVDPHQPAGHELVACHFCHTERSPLKKRYRYADDQASRSQELARFYAGIIKDYDIKRIIAELPTGGAPNSQAATDLARAATVLVAVGEVFGCAFEFYDPREVKKAATGKPTASKKEVMSAIIAGYPKIEDLFPTLVSGREHVCDAVGVWLAGKNGALARL